MFLFLILFICSFLNLTSLDLIPLNHLGIRRELCAFGLTSSLVLNGGSFALEIFITLAVYLFLHYYYSYYWPSTHLYIYIFIVCFTNLYYYLFVLLILLALIVLIISTLLSYGIIYITLCFVTTIIIGSTIIIRVYSLAIVHIVDIVLI